MKKLVLGLVLTILTLGVGALSAEAAPRTMGTTQVNNLPLHYGDTAEISWVLTKRPIRPTLGVECYQAKPDGDGYWWAYTKETPIPRDQTGSSTVCISNDAPHLLIVKLDPTLEAYCLALIWDEGTRNGKPPVFIAGGGDFTLLPEELP